MVKRMKDFDDYWRIYAAKAMYTLKNFFQLRAIIHHFSIDRLSATRSFARNF